MSAFSPSLFYFYSSFHKKFSIHFDKEIPRKAAESFANEQKEPSNSVLKVIFNHIDRFAKLNKKLETLKGIETILKQRKIRDLFFKKNSKEILKCVPMQKYI